jgi:tetratricopeptide (TPR) repeat protein
LGASRVLFGQVRRDSENVHIELSLLDPKALTRKLQAAIAQSSSDLSGLQDKVVNEVVRMLQLEPSARAHQVLAAGQTKTPGAYEAYIEGLGKLARYDQEANLDAAIVLLNRALEQDADYALAHAALGETYWRKYELTKEPTRIAEARSHCTQALKLDPESAAAHTTLGIIERGTGNYDDAVTQFKTALRLDPPNFKALRELARAYERKGKIQEAEAAFRKAITERPEDWATHNELAAFYWRQGRYSEAASSFREVIRLTPDSYLAHRNLGGLYFLMDKTEEAVAELNQSLTLKETPQAFSNLGTITFFKGDYAQAAKLYEQAIALGNPSRVLYGNLGDACRNAPGLEGKAAQAYRQAIELTEKNLEVNPNDAEERSSLALYCALTGDSTNALREVQRALEAGPENVNVMACAAQVYEKTGDRPTALRWLFAALKRGYSRAAIERDPDFAKLRQDPKYRGFELPPNQNTNNQTQK